MGHELQERVRRCRGKQGQVFTSAARMTPGLKGIAPSPPCLTFLFQGMPVQPSFASAPV